MDMHYCQGSLKSVAIIGKAANCHEQAKKSCHKKKSSCQYESSDSAKAQKDNCCNNKTVKVEADDAERLSMISADLADIEWPTAVTTLPHYQIEVVSSTQRGEILYRPPPLIPDIPSLYQVFLI